MVKKTKLQTNELSLDEGLDIPEFNFDFGETKDDRSPVHKILASAGQGVKDSFNDSSYIKRLLRASMPPVYGEVDDVATNISDNVKKLYNTAAKEIKPSLAEFARATEKLVPKGSRSNDALKKLKDWAEGYKSQSITDDDKKQIREKNIALEIADIFSKQAELQSSFQAENKAESKIKESIDLSKHKQSQHFLGQIANSTSRLAQYQDKITQAYQRKSLEIQFRNYFVGVESLEESKRSNELNKTVLTSIMKNTALPEYVKLKNTERFAEFSRNKLMEGLFGGTQGFLNKSFKNLGNIVKEYTDIAKDGLFSATQAAETAEMMKDMGGNKSMAETIAEQGAKGAVQYGAMKIGGKSREWLSKNKKVNRLAGNVRYGLNNLPEMATEYANKQNFEDGTVKTFFKSLLSDIIGNQKPDSSLMNDGVKDGMEPGMFTRFTNKSITEIIPGYLSRIFRELQILRTGDETIKLTGYDIYSNKFMDSASIKKSIMDRLVPQGAIKTHKGSGENIFKLIDPEGKLSEEEKAALLDKLTRDKFDRKHSSYERLTNKYTYAGEDGLGESSEKIAAAFEKYFTDDGKLDKDSDEFLEKRNKLSGAFGQLGRFLNNPASEIQNLVNAGYYEQLREMGLIDDQGATVNMEEVLKRHNPEKFGSFVSEEQANAFAKRKTDVKDLTPKAPSHSIGELPKELSQALLENSKTLRDFIGSSKENQIKFDAFVESQNETAGHFTKAFKNEALKVDAETSNEILLRIEDFLVNKLQFMGFGGSADGTGGLATAESRGYRKDTFGNNLLGIAGGLKRGLYDNFGKPLSKKIFNVGLATSKFGLNSLKIGLDKASKIPGTLAEMFTTARDIFVEGDVKAKLTKAGMEAGEYYDSVTGKVITSLDDLKKAKGDIFDKSKNVVLAKVDFGKTFVKNLKGNGIVNLGKSLFSSALNFAKFSSNAFLNTGAMMLRAAGKVKTGIFNLLDQPIDLFVKGESEPILFAITMKAGGYISEITGRPVMRPSEIDGPLKDLKGNFALTLDQLKKGLVDINGNKIKTPLMKILSAGLGVVGLGIKAAMKIGRMGTNMIKNGLNGGGEFLKGILDKLSVGIGGKKSTDILEQIRNILDDRLPKNKKKFGDKDGDGDRDGSWQDLAQNKKETVDDNTSTDATVDSGRENTFDRIARLAGTAKDKIAGFLGMGDDEDSDVDVDTDGSDNDGRRSRRGRKGKGRFKKKGGFGRTAGRVAGGAASGAGKLAWGATKLGGKALLGLGSMALPALGATIGGIGTAAGAIASGVGAAAAGIASVLSAPVVLGAAAIGLAGYGAYKLYKHMSKVELTPLLKLRMAQYGFTKDDNDQIARVIQIENLLLPQVTYDEGKAQFNIDDILTPKLMEASGLDPESTDKENISAIRKWTRWFTERFKPVFLTHLTAIKNTDPNQTLSTVDKMEPALKLKMLPALKFPDGPYTFYESPFKDLDMLQSGVKLVNYCFELAETAIKEEVKNGGEKKTKLTDGQTMGATAAAVAAAAKATDTQLTNANKPPASLPMTLKDKLLSGLKKGVFIMANPFAALGAFVVSTVGPAIGKYFGFGVNALEAVRFKAYGLVEMDRSKVVALRNLEEEMEGKITFNASGSAVFSGSVSELMTKISSDFSISGPNSKEAQLWSMWFGNRFLPVYLNFAALVRQASGTDSVTKGGLKLKSSVQLEIAKKIVATPSIWTITVSPWVDYILNTNSQSTGENIQHLVNTASTDTATEQKANKTSKDNATVTAKTGVQSGTPAVTPNVVDSKPTPTIREEGPGGTYDRLPGYSNKGVEAVLSNEGYRDKYDLMASKGKDQSENLKNTVPGSKKPKGNFSGFGGDIDTYIREASQTFGIDEKILRGFIKMEAGWTGKMSPTGAIGTGQFIQSTWDGLAKTEEGKKIGMTPIGNRFRTADDPRHDKRINTMATALLAKQNSDMLKKAGISPTGEMLYMMHNIGPGVISAVKSGQVNPATLKAMQQNGMQPGMTPVAFVDYQKERFNDHYALANSVAPNIGGSATDGVPIGRDNRGTSGPGSSSQSSTTAGATTAKPGTQPTTSTNGNSGSYAGSVENTKQNPGVAKTPTFTQGQLPKEQSPYTVGQRNNNAMGGFNMSGGAPSQQINNLNDSNRVISNVDKTLNESLSIQTQSLAVLREISSKMNFEQLASLLGGAKPKEEKPEPKPADSQYTEARVNQGKTKQIPKASVSMSRT